MSALAATVRARLRRAIRARVQRGIRPTPATVLADGWYGWVVQGFVPLTDLIERWPRRWREAVGRTGALRGLVLFVYSVSFDTVVVIRTDPGWRSLLLLRAVFGRRRKLIALHFIDHARRRSGRGAVVDLAWRPIDRWATRRALLAGQVLSTGEAELYAKRFGVEAERFRLIPFAWRMSELGAALPTRAGGSAEPPGPRGSAEPRVIAAGRAGCDWPTLFAAARRAAEDAARGEGVAWELTVVCGGHDLPEVLRLNSIGGRPLASVRADIPHEDARALLRASDIAVMAMRDGELSHGHVRLCDATDAGAAVVASRVASLDGYVVDGETVLLVPPEQPGALRAAVDRLRADPELRRRLAAGAFERAAGWTWDAYLEAIDALAHAENGGAPPKRGPSTADL